MARILPYAGVAQWLELRPSKPVMRVRFPSPAPVHPMAEHPEDLP